MRTCSIGLLALGLTVAVLGCARQAVPNPSVNEAAAPSPSVKEAAPPAGKSAGGAALPAPSAGQRFTFPPDKGGELLAALLRPPEPVAASPTDAPTGPRPQPVPNTLADPNPSLAVNRSELMRPPLALEALKVQPRPLPDDPPLSAYRRDPRPPQQQQLPASAGVRLPSPDVNEPVALPALAQPQVDRAPLDDPTGEASLKAALAAVPPVRDNRTPFLRLNLPDPFELSQTVRLASPPAEDPTPVASVSRPAKP